MSDLKLTAEEVAWVKAYVEARRTDASFCSDAAAKANAAARLAPAEPAAPVAESATTEPTLLEAAKAYAKSVGWTDRTYPPTTTQGAELRAAIAREEASARVDWKGLAEKACADRDAATRDLAACREQVKEAERDRDDWKARAESIEHRADVAETKAAKRHDTIVDLRAQLTAAEAERDGLAERLKASVPLCGNHGGPLLDVMRGLTDRHEWTVRYEDGTTHTARDDGKPITASAAPSPPLAAAALRVVDEYISDTPENATEREAIGVLRATLTAAAPPATKPALSSPPLAAERKYVAMHRNPLCDTAPPAAQSAAPSSPLAAVRKALEEGERHYKVIGYAEHAMFAEALATLPAAATPAAQVVEAAWMREIVMAAGVVDDSAWRCTIGENEQERNVYCVEVDDFAPLRKVIAKYRAVNAYLAAKGEVRK